LIVWVASFPRSGNSLVREILGNVFLLYGTSQYRAKDLADLVEPGYAPPPFTSSYAILNPCFDFMGPWEEFRAAAHKAPHDIYIKTHEPADDDSRAIYVVRDPRSALVSYCHFLRLRHPDQQVTMEDVIRGTIGYGSWSKHLDSWQPDRRRGTLLLRYEDLAARPEVAIEAIAKFVGMRPLRPWRDPFWGLHILRPDFYRSGSDAQNVSELNAGQRDLIETLHKPWMKRLGYDPD
jgi:Sulfotransferase domain